MTLYDGRRTPYVSLSLRVSVVSSFFISVLLWYKKVLAKDRQMGENKENLEVGDGA